MSDDARTVFAVKLLCDGAVRCRRPLQQSAIQVHADDGGECEGDRVGEYYRGVGQVGEVSAVDACQAHEEGDSPGNGRDAHSCQDDERPAPEREGERGCDGDHNQETGQVQEPRAKTVDRHGDEEQGAGELGQAIAQAETNEDERQGEGEELGHQHGEIPGDEPEVRVTEKAGIHQVRSSAIHQPPNDGSDEEPHAGDGEEEGCDWRAPSEGNQRARVGGPEPKPTAGGSHLRQVAHDCSGAVGACDAGKEPLGGCRARRIYGRERLKHLRLRKAVHRAGRAPAAGFGRRSARWPVRCGLRG